MTTVNPLFVKLCIPSGLEEVLEGLAREVLRRQPENINSFAAVYFDKLLAIRNEAETRGSDMNLPNLIARGKFMDINEEELIKISIKDETLQDGDEIQPIMVTAASISKPAQIEIKQPADVVINEDDEKSISTNTEYENKVNSFVPEGVLVDKIPEESDLVKIVTNQNAEELEIREIQSEKSSDNSEMDEEEPEVLESELETAIGLQKDQGDGILLQTENVNFLVKAKSETDVDNKILQDSIEEINNLENTNAIFAPGSARALKTEEFQLNDKPSQLIDENENTELIKYQSDGILSTENEKTDNEETIDDISSDELITIKKIAESGESLSLKTQIEAEREDFVDKSTKETDDDNKVKNLQEEEIEEGSLSEKLPTSSEIQEIIEDSSIKPVIEVDDDSVIVVEGEKSDIELVKAEEIIDENSSNEIITTYEILESDKDSSLKPIESEMEDSEDKLVKEIDDKDVETKVLNEIVETSEIQNEIQNEITDNESASIPNTAEKQTLMAVDGDDGDEEDKDARRETETETNNERNMETQEQTEKGSDTDIKKEKAMEEAREDSQDSEVMFTVNEKSETVEITEIGEDLSETNEENNEEISKEDDKSENEPQLKPFEAQAMSQQPEMIQEIKINQNFTENMVAEEAGLETDVETNKDTYIVTNEETNIDNKEETENGEEMATGEIGEESQGSEVMSTNNQKSETSEETETVKDLLQEQNLLQLNVENAKDGLSDNETGLNEVIVNDTSNSVEDLFEVQAVSQQPETIQEINITENLIENIALEDTMKESFQTSQINDDDEKIEASQEESLGTTDENSLKDPEQNDENSSEGKIPETLQILEITPEEKQADSLEESEESSNQQIYEVQPLIQDPEEIEETEVDTVKETTNENASKDEFQEMPQITEIINDNDPISTEIKPDVSTIDIEDYLPEKIEENVLADELQEVFQSVQMPEDDKQSEVDESQFETTASTKDKLEEISQPVENIPDDAQEVTEINPENLEIAKEENLLEDQIDEKVDTEIEILPTVQNLQKEEKPETENGSMTEPVDETDEEIYKPQTMTLESDEIEGNILENEFEENSQTAQNNENNILDDISSEKVVLTDKIEEKALEEEVLQLSQQPAENDMQYEIETNQTESLGKDSNTLKTDSNLAIDESEKLSDVALESSDLQEDGNLAYGIKNDVDVSEQITYDMPVSASADEGQETKNKPVEERNDNEPVNTEEIVDTQSIKVNDTLRTEVPDRDSNIIDQIQNADKVEILEGKPEEIKKTSITSLLQNGELEESNVEKSNVITEPEAEIFDEINDDLKISKDIGEDEIMDNSEENLTQLNTDSNQNTTERNSKEFQQNIDDLNEEIQLSDNAEKQTNDVHDVQEADKVEETTKASIEEEGIDVKSILEEPESQKEISSDDAMIQDENSDDVINKENVIVTEEALTPKTILKTEEVFANLVNESKEIDDEIIENTESVEIPMEGSMEKQIDGLTELNQELDEGILEENSPLDSILPDDSQITNEDFNQIETQKEGVVGEQLEETNKDNQQTNEVKAIENEADVVEESMSSLSTSNEQNAIPISEPLNSTDQSPPQQDFQMESPTIQPTNPSKIEAEINEIADITNDDAQEKQITEISENLIMPEINQQLTSELVDNINIGNPDVNIEDPENITSQILTESNQPSIVFTSNDEEIRNENTNSSDDIEMPSNNLNNIIEEQRINNLNDEILEIDNNAIIEMDSLEYENKRVEDVLGINDEAPELDSLEYIKEIGDGQDLDSLEISNTMPEIQDLESSPKIDEISINEENPKLENEQILMATDQEPVTDDGSLTKTTTDSSMDVIPSTNVFNNIQLDNELESEEKIDVQLDNSINATEITIHEQPVKEAEVAQKVSNEPDFEQTSDEKIEIDQGKVIIVEEESTNDLPEEESTEGIPEVESTNDIPEVESTNDIPEDESTEGIPEEESTNDLPEENAENRVLLQASIPQDDNSNNEMQIANSDEQVDVISEPESEVLTRNNDEELKISGEINADDDDDDGKMLKSSEEKSSDTNIEAAQQASEFEITEQTEISNEKTNDIDIAEQKDDDSRFVNDDIPAISEEIVMKEIVDDLETNTEGNLESITEMQDADDVTNTTKNVEEEVNEPEIIKEIEQLDEPNFTELYNKLENSIEENSNENMDSENQELEQMNDPEKTAMDERIINLNEIGNSLKTDEENDEFKNTNEVDEKIIEGPVQLEESNETVGQDLTEANAVAKEEVIVTEEEIKPDVIENVSNEQPENNQNEYKEPNVDIVETLMSLDNNKEDEATDFDQRETLNKTEEQIQNEEENLKVKEEKIRNEEENLKEIKEEIQNQEENLKEDVREIRNEEENLKEEEEKILIQEEFKEKEEGIQNQEDNLKEEEGKTLIQKEDFKEDEKEIRNQEEKVKEEEREIRNEEENLQEDEDAIQNQGENLKEEEKEIQNQEDNVKEEEGEIRNEEENLKEEEEKILIQEELKEEEVGIKNQEDNLKEEEREIRNEEEDLKVENEEILIKEEDLKEEEKEIQNQDENLKEEKEEIQNQQRNLKNEKEEIQNLKNLQEDEEEIQNQEENAKEEKEELQNQEENAKEEKEEIQNQEENAKEEKEAIQNQEENFKEGIMEIRNEEGNLQEDEDDIQNQGENLKEGKEEIQNSEASLKVEEEKTKNLESQEASTQSEEILTEKEENRNIQENIDKDLLLLDDKLSKEITLAEQLFTLDAEEVPVVNNGDETSEKDESTQVSETTQTENMAPEKPLETSEVAMLEAIQTNTNGFQTDEITEETTPVEKTDNNQTNLNDETLTENDDNDNINNADNNNGGQAVDDSSSKTTTNQNIELASPSKEIVEEKVPEPMRETNEISELENIQNPDKLQNNDIQKNGDDSREVLELDNKNEENPVMSDETSLLEQDVNVDKSTDLPETNLTMTTATEKSLDTKIDDSEAPILSEDLQDESMPKNQIEEKDEVAGKEQDINDDIINDDETEKIQETLQEGEMTQLDAEKDIEEVMAVLDGQTDEIMTLTDLETDLVDETRNKLSNKAQIRDGIPKTMPEEQRKPKEQDKNDVRGKEQVKEEASVNGFEILGHSIVLKPKKNFDKTDANIEQEVEERVDKTQVATTEGLPDASTDDNKIVSQDESKGLEMEMGTKDFIDINDQSDDENTINEGDDQDEDNDVMIGQGLTSPPEEQITAINNLLP